MCGICGIYGEGDKSRVKDMTETLQHRGPDSWGIQFDKHCVLGHRRLAILDLSENGDQPMSNEDGSVWLVVNGEIYNYKSLRAQLQDRGHLFKSQSDSEVIVHGYEEWGVETFEKLRGMFALAIYDRNEERLLLARDPIGKKPLYFSWHEGRLYFASEIKALLAAGVPARVNYDAIPSYLLYQYVPGIRTLFDDIFKVAPGAYFEANQYYTDAYPYWSLKETKEDGRNLRQLLKESVGLRLQSDVPVGAFLSGGIDSSAVCALWREQTTGRIDTFTAVFPGWSESEFAKKVCKVVGGTYHEVEITPDMVRRDIERITWHHDEPLGDAAVINNYYLAQEARKHVTVVLAGEGGDEVFGGYPWYDYAPYIDIMRHIPGGVRSVGRALLQYWGAGDVTYPHSLGRIAMFPLQKSLTDMVLYPTTAMSGLTVNWLLKRNGWHTSPVIPENVTDPYNLMLAYDCLNLLPEKFLMKADKATMAWGIEERLPLLDKEVIEYGFSLPVAQKKHKLALRKAVEDLLPAEIVWRPKKGFGTPIDSWLARKDFNEMVLETLSSGTLLHEICKPAALQKVFVMAKDAHFKKLPLALSPLNVIWGLFALETWYRVWFGGKA